MPSECLVVSGPSKGSEELARGIAKALDAELVTAEFKEFPDGESYVRVEGVKERKVVVVNTLSAPQNASLVQALLLADAVKGAGARRAVLVAPYMAYARQDRRFLEGEPISISVVLRSLYAAGYDGLVTVEIHKEESLRFFPAPHANIRPLPYIVKTAGVEADLVVAPDLGAIERARQVADAIKADYDYLVKKRDRVTGEIVLEPKEIKAQGLRVLIVDDIISTGGTIAKASEDLLSQGASSVEVAVVHALMVGDAVNRVRGSGVKRVYAANTLPRIPDPLITYVDVSPLIGDSVARLAKC